MNHYTVTQSQNIKYRKRTVPFKKITWTYQALCPRRLAHDYMIPWDSGPSTMCVDDIFSPSIINRPCRPPLAKCVAFSINWLKPPCVTFVFNIFNYFSLKRKKKNLLETIIIKQLLFWGVSNSITFTSRPYR